VFAWKILYCDIININMLRKVRIRLLKCNKKVNLCYKEIIQLTKSNFFHIIYKCKTLDIHTKDVYLYEMKKTEKYKV